MPRLSRRALVAPVIAFLAAGSALAATAPTALADDSSTLTVVGTSDVYDSNLVQSVIKPGFEAANPGITLNYVSLGTGAAINYAKSGSASALIVHAASLENQFVADGYSLEDYGRAIFWGDYVLLGPANDPAKVMSGGQPSHDIATAFEKIAAAGKKGTANFVSRGGTPGTTVQEHAIWALTSGVKTCTVSTANGGGLAPSSVSGACQAPPTNPAWYHTTGASQAPNVLNGDACQYTGGGCYVFTDRGTFQYLRSQGSIAHLQIVGRDNSDSKRGTSTVLVNSFHAYGINPDKFAGNSNVSINVAGARKFLSWITSAPAQTSIGNYLAGDVDGAAFIPDAAPEILASVFPKSTTPTKPFTITGLVRNVVPGTPLLGGEKVTLNFTPSADTSQHIAVATAMTAANGKYSLTYQPTAAGTYTVTTGLISVVEDPSLTPAFGDLLSPGTTTTRGPVAITASVTLKHPAGGVGLVTGTVAFSPAVQYTAASVDLYVAPASDPAAPLKLQATKSAAIGKTGVPISFKLKPGTWRIAVHYKNPNVITEAVTPETTVTVS